MPSTSEITALLTAITALVGVITAFYGKVNNNAITKLTDELAASRLENKENLIRLAEAKGLNVILETDLGGSGERITKLRAGLIKDGDRKTLDAVLETDDKDKIEQEGKQA